MEASGNPGCIHLEFYDEDSIRSQQALSRLERLERIHVVINPNIGEMGARRVGVKQRENDKIKTIIAVLDVAPRIVAYLLYTRRAVGLFKVEPFAQLQDQGVDFHCCNAPGTISECGSHIVPHSRTQDQHGGRLRIEVIRQVVSIPFNRHLRK